MAERASNPIPAVVRSAKRAALYAVCLGLEIPVTAHRILRRVLRRDPRILLVAQNRLMAEYVLRVWDTISDSPDIEGWILDDDDALIIPVEDSALRSTTFNRAAAQWWDAIVLADQAPLRFAPSIPRVAVSHGLARSRRVPQKSYYYDRSRIFWPDRRRVYSVLFEASDDSRDWALNLVPEYRDAIEVVGDIRAFQKTATSYSSCRLGVRSD